MPCAFPCGAATGKPVRSWCPSNSMNLRPLLVVLGALAFTSATLPHRTRSAVTDARVRYTINDHWRYASGPVDGAEAVAFADSSWSAVTLPHTWNLEDAF